MVDPMQVLRFIRKTEFFELLYSKLIFEIKNTFIWSLDYKFVCMFHPNLEMCKTRLILLLLIFSNKFNASIGNDKQVSSPATWTSFIKTLNYCTIQVFYESKDFKSWDIISNQIQHQNHLLNVNFVMENLSYPKNRYIRADVNQLDGEGIIKNFPFKENYSGRIFSNCQIVIISPPVNPLLLMWGIAAFNEDPDYIIILDHYPGGLHRLFNFYFSSNYDFRLTSILLHSNITSRVLSIVCYTCTPIQQISDQNDRSILITKLFPVKDTTLSKFSKYYKQLIKNFNHHPIYFPSMQYRRFWKIPCSLKHSGLGTSERSCPVSELIHRLNFTAINSKRNIIGYIASNVVYNEATLKHIFLTPGSVVRLIWIKQGIEYRKVYAAIFTLPIELNAHSLIRIFDVLSFSILILFGGCFSLIIFKNHKFVFAPAMWTVSIFLLQGTNFVIKPMEAIKITRFRVFMTYWIILIWLFNAFYVGSIFSGEFFSFFTSNRVPQVPQNLKDLARTKDIPIVSCATTFTRHENNFVEISSVKENIIPQLLAVEEHSTEFRKTLHQLKKRIQWVKGLNVYSFARWASLNGRLNSNQTQNIPPSIIAVIDYSDTHKILETSFGVFKKYFIISNHEEILYTEHMPWVTSRNPFGVIFEENIFYMSEAGVLAYWGKNFQRHQFLNEVKYFYKEQVKQKFPEKNYTNYFQKAILNRRESNSVELVREGEPIGVDKIKMLFILYALCIGISALWYAIEKRRFIIKGCIRCRK